MHTHGHDDDQFRPETETRMFVRCIARRNMGNETRKRREEAWTGASLGCEEPRVGHSQHSDDVPGHKPVGDALALRDAVRGEEVAVDKRREE
eukprot:866525-Rhodomonas_salina.2